MKNYSKQRGFTMLEVIVVVVILLVVMAFATPNVMSFVHSYRLQGSASDFSGVVEACRLRAVQDDRFYSVYFLNGQAFADIYPQSNNGASGSGGTAIDNRDPQISLSFEVTPVAVGSAPNTDDLKGKFLPPGSTLTPQDASPAGAPITFSPRGLPCATQTATLGAVNGTVCTSASGPTAFWVFFQNTSTSNWQAVTLSPAGRIRRWAFDSDGLGGGTWRAM